MSDIFENKGALAATIVVAASDSLNQGQANYVCDGVNDHVEIQAALDALPATGGEVLLLDGTYNIEVSLVLDSYQTLRGCGSNTILTTTSGINILQSTGGAGTEKVNIIIADLSIDGTDNCTSGIRFEYVDNSRIFNIWLRNCAANYGIIFATSDQNMLLHSEITGANTGIYVNESTDNIIADCIFSGHAFYAIDIYHGDRTIIANNNLPANDGEGIVVDASYHVIVVGNRIVGAARGIHIDIASYETVIADNVIVDSDAHGILIDEGDQNIVSNNRVHNSGSGGIAVAGNYTLIAGNNVDDSEMEGISVEGTNNVIASNIVHNSGSFGIEISGSYDTIVGNMVDESDLDGIECGGSHHLVANNIVVSSGKWVDNSYANIDVWGVDDSFITGNLCRQGALANRPNYGIYVHLSSNRNRIINNDLYDSGKSGAISNNNVTTELATYVVPFSDGSDPQDSGYLIDDDTEYARAWLRLPDKVVQVVRMKVYARSVVTEADHMRGEFVVYGGADNEAYTTHNGSVANHPSTSVDFAVDDVIHWTLTTVGVLALLGGDSIEVKVLHEAASNGDCATNAYLRTVEIEYV